MTERKLGQEPKRIARRRAIGKDSEPQRLPLDEDQLRMEIANSRFHELFDLLGHRNDYSRTIIRSRNPDVDHETAWNESSRVVGDVYPEVLNPEKYNPNVVKNVFIVERERFVATLKDRVNFRTDEIRSNYRVSRSRALRELSEEDDIRRHEILAEVLFEQGFFRK